MTTHTKEEFSMDDYATPLSEERKQQILSEHPEGLWIVLREEYPQDDESPADLLGGEG